MFDNPLLDSVPAELLHGRVNTLDFVKGDVLAQPESPIERLIFPRSGLLSVVVELTDGAQIEAAMIGPGGALGGAAMFGAKIRKIVGRSCPGISFTFTAPAPATSRDRSFPTTGRQFRKPEQSLATCHRIESPPRKRGWW